MNILSLQHLTPKPAAIPVEVLDKNGSQINRIMLIWKQMLWEMLDDRNQSRLWFALLPGTRPGWMRPAWHAGEAASVWLGTTLTEVQACLPATSYFRNINFHQKQRICHKEPPPEVLSSVKVTLLINVNVASEAKRASPPRCPTASLTGSVCMSTGPAYMQLFQFIPVDFISQCTM